MTLVEIINGVVDTRKYINNIISDVIRDNTMSRRKLCKLCGDIGTIILHNTIRSSHRFCDTCFIGAYKEKIDDIYKKVQIGNCNDTKITCIGNIDCQRMSNMCKVKVDIKAIKFTSFNHEINILYKKINNITTYLSLHKETLLCPNLQCCELSPSDKDAKCTFCKLTWCKKCLVYPNHIGMTCNEYKLINENSTDPIIINDIKNGMAKLCPNCNACVYRIDGCNAMKCRCRTIFCWLCGATMISEYAGHFSIYTCPQFGRNAAQTPLI
jgi:hypothetical protein